MEGKIQAVTKKLVGLYYNKILYVDLTDNYYQVLKVGTDEWKTRDADGVSTKISDWFQWFSLSALCHEADRDKFSAFVELDTLRKTFVENGYTPLQLTYRRKNKENDKDFHTEKMDIIPDVDERGHQVAYIFIRDLINENETLNQRLEVLETKNELFTKRLDFGKSKLLIVEDNDIDRELLEELLAEDYESIYAQDGVQAMEILRKQYNEISLVIMDIYMPEMDGNQCLQEIKRDPLLSVIPVVMMTSERTVEVEEDCLAMGAVDFIRKPFNPKLVKSRIKNIIRLHDSAAKLFAVEFDDLTGLLTRQAFFHHADLYLKANPETKYDLVISDISNFKLINERYGEKIGDQLLHSVGEQLKLLENKDTLVGRFGGDRFAIFMKHEGSISKEKLLRPYQNVVLEGVGLELSPKFGIYENVDHELPISVLCDCALTALRTIKNQYEKVCEWYDDRIQNEEKQIKKIELEMQKALDEEQFKIYYQPKHDCLTGRIAGAEALVRWIHPDLGFMSPGHFIPLFEKNGFITKLDAYVIKKVCQDMKRWDELGMQVVPVSANVSRRDFFEKGWIEEHLKMIDDFAIDSKMLHIEVTESLYAEDMDAIIHQVRMVRKKGHLIEMDDFGAGYSTLGMLADFPVDVIKLDISFVRKLQKNEVIIDAIIKMAHSMGYKTVAEGVETEEQYLKMKELGCDYIQGYYFSKPLPCEEFEEYLIKNQKEEPDFLIESTVD